eukprot:m.240096 g.240096  ORF g.240096 m.240096 type:complete len:117 (+) comp15819_c0_seq7:258-608(+)
MNRRDQCSKTHGQHAIEWKKQICGVSMEKLIVNRQKPSASRLESALVHQELGRESHLSSGGGVLECPTMRSLQQHTRATSPEIRERKSEESTSWRLTGRQSGSKCARERTASQHQH